jgi:hypothetical protein
MTFDPTTDISHVIELAVAPVFLLAGIGAFTNVFAVRLGRIFDRIRLLEQDVATRDAATRQHVLADLVILQRRARLTYLGIALDIVAALLVCILVAAAFIEHFFAFEIRGLIGGLFIGAMLALIGGLVAFLREVFIAVRSLRFGLPPEDG